MFSGAGRKFWRWSVATPARMWTSIIIAVSLVLLWIVLQSHLFQECVQANNSSNTSQSFYEGLRDIIWVRWWCVGIFIDGNGGSITALATVALTISTIGLWAVTESTLKHTEVTSERELPPWLTINCVAAGDLTYRQFMGGHGMAIDLTMEVRNVGKEPARNVFFRVEANNSTNMDMLEFADWYFHRQMDISARDTDTGFLLAPNDVVRVAATAVLFDPELQRVMPITGRRFVSPSVAAIVTYRSIGTDVLRHTAKVFDLVEQQANNVSLSIDLDKMPIPIHQIALLASPLGAQTS